MTDQELIRFAADFRAGILGDTSSRNMCYAVCSPLAALLAAHGVEVELVESRMPIGSAPSNHIWLHLPDGRALDPTADQFRGLPPVYLGPPKRRIHRRPGTPDRTELTAEGAALAESDGCRGSAESAAVESARQRVDAAIRKCRDLGIEPPLVR